MVLRYLVCTKYVHMSDHKSTTHDILALIEIVNVIDNDYVITKYSTEDQTFFLSTPTSVTFFIGEGCVKYLVHHCCKTQSDFRRAQNH